MRISLSAQVEGFNCKIILLRFPGESPTVKNFRLSTLLAILAWTPTVLFKKNLHKYNCAAWPISSWKCEGFKGWSIEENKILGLKNLVFLLICSALWHSLSRWCVLLFLLSISLNNDFLLIFTGATMPRVDLVDLIKVIYLFMNQCDLNRWRVTAED